MDLIDLWMGRCQSEGATACHLLPKPSAAALEARLQGLKDHPQALAHLLLRFLCLHRREGAGQVRAKTDFLILATAQISLHFSSQLSVQIATGSAVQQGPGPSPAAPDESARRHSLC